MTNDEAWRTSPSEVGACAVTPLAVGERSAMGKALRLAALPADDLEDECARVRRRRDGVMAGYGGLEIHGDDALVRSIIVEPLRRRRGAGQAIVERLLAEAAELGAERAYLLTTNACAYFATLGFAAVARADAPATILATRQAVGLLSLGRAYGPADALPETRSDMTAFRFTPPGSAARTGRSLPPPARRPGGDARPRPSRRRSGRRRARSAGRDRPSA